MDTQDVDLPGPVETLFSLLYDTPVFSGDGTKRTELRYDPKSGLDPIVRAIETLAMRPDLSDVFRIQNADMTAITGSLSEAGEIERRFHGVCVGNTVYALARANAQTGSTDLSGNEGNYILRKAAYMAESYRPDIQGCRQRFLELVNTKFREGMAAESSLQAIEVLNFGFSFIPGYAGAENFTTGNTLMGSAEIIADIATLGAASKFKAGWRSLNMSKQLFRSIQTGFRVGTLGANTVRLGGLIRDASSGGASISDIPTAVLLVAETGFVLAKIKVRRTRLSAAQRAIANATNIIDATPLREALTKLGRRLISVAPGSVKNLFLGKYKQFVGPEELERIRQVIRQGGDPGLDDLHKLISNTSLKKPDTLINVTADNTFLQVLDSNGRYYGYVGFPGLPKGMYATPKPISWSAWDMAETAGSKMPRDTMFVFVGEAADDFKKVRVESGFFGGNIVTQKTTLKPGNPEFATSSGDVRFRDFSVYHDGSKSVVVVKKIEIMDSLHGLEPGSAEYKALTRVRVLPFAMVVACDISGVIIATGGPLIALAGSAMGIEWLFSDRE